MSRFKHLYALLHFSRNGYKTWTQGTKHGKGIIYIAENGSCFSIFTILKIDVGPCRLMIMAFREITNNKKNCPFFGSHIY